MSFTLPPLRLNRAAVPKPVTRTRPARKEHRIAEDAESKAALKAMSRAVLSYRAKNNLTQRELAHAVGCSRQIIAHIEYRNCAPSLSVYLALCRTMGTPKPPLT